MKWKAVLRHQGGVHGWLGPSSLQRVHVSFRGTGDRSKLAVDHVPGPGADSQPAPSLVEEERGGRWNF